MQRFVGLLLTLILSAALLGCRPHRDDPEASVPTSRVEHFKQRQAATELTHGRIRLDTVEESPTGKIKYQTTDGKTWLVDMTADAKGGYRYGTPEEVK